ncbi:hypothetical protein SISSUDRAFT_886596 [Sistotremastrum suecicum HHB10207 ss-3]|nr:hypothetical protein SISSUDRAFT_886596 [Sistotremastrum suecicum HHB10207 ss-3]
MKMHETKELLPAVLSEDDVLQSLGLLGYRNGKSSQLVKKLPTTILLSAGGILSEASKRDTSQGMKKARNTWKSSRPLLKLLLPQVPLKVIRLYEERKRHRSGLKYVPDSIQIIVTSPTALLRTYDDGSAYDGHSSQCHDEEGEVSDSDSLAGSDHSPELQGSDFILSSLATPDSFEDDLQLAGLYTSYSAAESVFDEFTPPSSPPLP